MKTLAMVRKIDDLGRVVIPCELRRAMELDKGDALEMYLEEDRLVMRKFAPACIFCGGIEELMTYEGRNLCSNCIRIIKNS